MIYDILANEGLKVSLENPSHIRRSILSLLKQAGPSTLAKLALETGVTKEAVRRQLASLHQEGWVEKGVVRENKARSGRPTTLYALTSEGDHFFPKDYDSLAVEILETLGQDLGQDALRRLLSKLTETRIEKWAPLLAGKSLSDKVKSLKNLYQAGDPFTSVSESPDGFRLVERNCPFLNVASRQPALCSVTVSALTRLLGVKVVREERFQSNHGRCVFRIYKKKPVGRTSQFQLEPELLEKRLV